jgi:hypothetical protein
MENSESASYPLLFISLIEFALVGVVDDVKKKKSQALTKDSLNAS